MRFNKRDTTFFEKVLLIAGFFMGFLGFFMINKVFVESGRVLSYEMVIAVFIWIIMLFLIILAASAENQKEEEMHISSELHEETKLLKGFTQDQLAELKLLRKELAALKKK
ncbi:MAG: hypothetical protein ACMXYK_02670 [Candidatus Woesearchaeota archaeon]